jgi:hypothetical protein
MKLDQWLQQVYDEEELIKEGENLEATFSRMDPADLLELAVGGTIPEKTKEAGVRDFFGTLKRNPKSADLDRAFSAYEKDTGRKPNTMSSAQINQYLDKTKQASRQEKLVFMDKVARQIARQHAEVEKSAGAKRMARIMASYAKNPSKALAAAGGRAEMKLRRSMTRRGMSHSQPAHTLSHASPRQRTAIGGMIKQDEFTSSAVEKAAALQRAMAVTEGAPAEIRAGAIKLAGRELQKAAARGMSRWGRALGIKDPKKLNTWKKGMRGQPFEVEDTIRFGPSKGKKFTETQIVSPHYTQHSSRSAIQSKSDKLQRGGISARSEKDYRRAANRRQWGQELERKADRLKALGRKKNPNFGKGYVLGRNDASATGAQFTEPARGSFKKLNKNAP